jgi:SAM-dependent methyltransferase
VAINLITLAWMERLVARNVLRGGAILDLGPQDLYACPRRSVQRIAEHLHPPLDAGVFLSDIFYDQTFRQLGGTRALYRMLGFEHYRAVDLTDSRADWRVDLNAPEPLPETFDVITNFGTAEHVFDIARVFRFVHDTLKVGGVALHSLPSFGEIGHGFFNVHPTTYFDLAAANGYAIEDLVYLDSIDIRCHLQMAAEVDFDFDALPIQRQHLDGPDAWYHVINQYFATVNRHGALFQKVNAAPKDLICAALRKQTDRPFRNPIQGLYRAAQAETQAVSAGAAGVAE